MQYPYHDSCGRDQQRPNNGKGTPVATDDPPCDTAPLGEPQDNRNSDEFVIKPVELFFVLHDCAYVGDEFNRDTLAALDGFLDRLDGLKLVLALTHLLV